MTTDFKALISRLLSKFIPRCIAVTYKCVMQKYHINAIGSLMYTSQSANKFFGKFHERFTSYVFDICGRIVFVLL